MREATAARVAVVGSANVDLVVRVRSLPLAGETVLGDNLLQLPGGKGANQASACAELGATTFFIGAVGGDATGDWMTEQLQRHGVHTDYLAQVAEPTGTALIVVDEFGENTIVVAPGANSRTAVHHVDLGTFDVVMAQQEISTDTVLAAARQAQRFVLNAAPSRPISAELLAECDVVIVNETEVAHVDRNVISHLVVTLGAKGAQYLIDGVVVADAAPPTVTPIDTVGAGDVFCAAFAVRFALGDSPQEILQYAVTAGALATLAPGAQGALPTHEEVMKWLPPAL